MECIFEKKEDCCGCSACYNICPKDAIKMTADREGFLYPEINQYLCINCQLCKKVCPVINEKELKNKAEGDFYLAIHKSNDVLKNSTSGGAFTAVSDIFLKENGIICGVDFDDSFCVVHKMTETREERDRFRFSKYVQSELGDIFTQIRKELIAGRKILFSGTPCQCAGLKAYIGNTPLKKNLYICDLICHSIPSPFIWEEFKKILEKENGGILDEVHFRTKKLDWSRSSSNKSFLFSTTEMDGVQGDERFYKMFFGLLSISRPSCSACRFTDTHRVSDITIADYFGIEEFAPEKYDKRGLSLVIVNNEKGEEILNKMKTDMEMEKRKSSESVKHQQRLSYPISYPENREEFWDNVIEVGLEETMKKYKIYK